MSEGNLISQASGIRVEASDRHPDSLEAFGCVIKLVGPGTCDQTIPGVLGIPGSGVASFGDASEVQGALVTV